MRQKAKRRGKLPRRSATVNEWKPRLTFADQRRRRVNLRAGQIPAHAELQVMRSDVLEGRRVVDVVGAVERAEVARQAIAHIEIAIGEFDREAWWINV